MAKNVKRMAKESFANALSIVKDAFIYEMQTKDAGFGDALVNDKGFEKALHKAQLKFNDMVNDYHIINESSNHVEFFIPRNDLSYSDILDKGIVAEFIDTYGGEFYARETSFDKNGEQTSISLCFEFGKDFTKDVFGDFGFDTEFNMVRFENGRFIVEVV